jgi:hypothetical protein
MVVGLRCGQYIPGDVRQKEYCGVKTAELMEAFRVKHGSVTCHDLLGAEFWALTPEERKATQPQFKGFCADLVASAVHMVESMEFE